MVATRIERIRARAAAAQAAMRRRWGWLDHLVRAHVRYRDSRGGSLAGAATFFGFLSFFPLVALAFSVAGYAAALDPHAAARLRTVIHSVLPGLAGQLPIESIAAARAGAGIAGLLGLLIAGLGGVGSLREGLHVIWGSAVDSGNVVIRKATDAGVLAVLGCCLLATAAASALAVSAGRYLLRWAGVGSFVPGQLVVRLLAIAVALIFDTVMFAVVFSRLSGARLARKQLAHGAVAAAAGFQVLNVAGVYLVAHTTRNPVYASFAVTVGLLVWINLVARLTFLAAAWTATASRLPGAARPAGNHRARARRG